MLGSTAPGLVVTHALSHDRAVCVCVCAHALSTIASALCSESGVSEFGGQWGCMSSFGGCDQLYHDLM